MTHPNQNPCRCEKTSCGCTTAAATRCTCGAACPCQPACGCANNCGCAKTK